MTITQHSKELQWRFLYLLGSYSLTVSIFASNYSSWLGWVFWPFESLYPQIQWQYHYGLEGFFIFWKMILGGAILWMIPWISLQWRLYKRIGQWEKESSSLGLIWIWAGCFGLGYGLYYWGYPWILLGNSPLTLGILIQPTVSDLVQWFYRCLIFPGIVYGFFFGLRNRSFWKNLSKFRHYYWLGCLVLAGLLTPPDGLSQIGLWLLGVLGLEYQIGRVLFRDVTKR